MIEKAKGCPPEIRVSTGSAAVLGLQNDQLDASPTTAYLMTYHEGKCAANCAFCPQARGSQSGAEQLSRVKWPSYLTATLLERLGKTVRDGRIQRVCIQTLNYPGVFDDVCAIVKALKAVVAVPVSVSCQPLNAENMWLLSMAGVDRIGIALDGATETLFDRVKGVSAGGPYRWRDVRMLLRVAVGVFGEGNVSTHLIVGLGETEKEMVQSIQECVDLGVLPALFAFTPIRGTALAARSPPDLCAYRRLQLSRYLIVTGVVRAENMLFDKDDMVKDFGVSKSTLLSIVETGLPFLTSGCPGCNRPFYNEKPGGPLYNYPRGVQPEELREIKRKLRL